MTRKPYLAALAASTALLGVHAVYLGVGWFVFESGADDLVFRLTGIARRAQLDITASLFLVVAAPGACAVLVRVLGLPDFSDNRRDITLVSALIFLNCLAASVSALLAEIHPAFWPYLFGYLAGALVLQTAIVHLVLRRVRNAAAVLAVLVALATWNAVTLFSSILDVFVLQAVWLQVLIGCVFVVALTALFCGLGRGRRVTWRVNTILAVTAAVPFALAVYQVSGKPVPPETERFAGIAFERRPDVHLLAVESLMPPVLAKRRLGLETVGYEAVLSGPGAMPVRNGFASRIPTVPSLNSVMRLGDPALEQPAFGHARYPYFHGQLDSPVARIFRENGYDVSTGASVGSDTFAGPYISETSLPENATILNSLFCRVAKKPALALYFLCPAADLFVDAEPTARWVERVAERIGAVAPGARPQFTFFHVPITGHTDANTFRYDDAEKRAAYAARYGRAAEDVGRFLADLRRRVEQGGRRAVVVVFGDHGPYLSNNTDPGDDPAFFVTDRYGIALGTLVNGSGCAAERFLVYREDGYMTPERLLAGIIRCLAKNGGALDAELSFDEDHAFGEYLYE